MESVILVSPSPDLASNAVFKNREAFARYDVDMGMIFTGTGEPVVRAMLDGRGGYTHVCGAPVPAAVAGRGLKILGAFQTSSFGLYAHPDIKSLKQLGGKSISLTGSITRPALETALRRYGVPIESVKIVGGGERRRTGSRTDQDGVRAVLDGEIDAISANQPQSQVAQRAGLQCILRFGDVYPIPTNALLTTDTLLRERRGQVANVMRGLLDSIDDFIRDRGLGISLLRDLGIPEELLEGTYWEMRGYLRPDARLPEEVQRMWIDWSREVLGLTEEVPISRVFDFSVLEEVLERR
jgi:ABC-type nitrate/sulfonate/bicarbonate transport system substrate-binding protein